MSGHKLVAPRWRDDWDVDAMRFMIRKTRSDSDAGGEQWSVYDMELLRVIARADTRKAAQLVADALEFLSCQSSVDDFESAIEATA